MNAKPFKFWCEWRYFLCNRSNVDIFTCENNMLFLRVKISCFRAKAHLVFHCFLYNKSCYPSNILFFNYFHPISFKKICQWTTTPQLSPRFTADSTQSPTVVTLTRPFHFLAHQARNSAPAVSWLNKGSKKCVFILDLLRSRTKTKWWFVLRAFSRALALSRAFWPAARFCFKLDCFFSFVPINSKYSLPYLSRRFKQKGVKKKDLIILENTLT